MTIFDFGKLAKKAKDLFVREINNSRSVQDEIKIFNERYPKHLEALEKLVIEDSGVGEFDGAGGSGVGGQLQYLEKGKYWTSSDLTKHDLRKTTSTLTSGQLNAWLSSKLGSRSSNMAGMGEAFMEGGRKAGIDPRYLIAHAAIESAWGTSNINADKHNFYGIGAFDNSPYASAYDWSDPRDGIIGGAEWIGRNYIHSEKYNQNTLHKMKFNNGTHEYATDPEWANKIASTMKGSEEFTTASEGGAPEGSGKFKNPYRDSAYTVTSEFGMRIHPKTGKKKGHAGIDVQSVGAKKVKLYATAPGKIVRNVKNYGTTSWGNYCVIDHGNINGKNVFSLYAHMKDPTKLKVGDNVGADSFISNEGNTGSVSGPTGIHLHLEIREGSSGQTWDKATPVDPRNYISF